MKSTRTASWWGRATVLGVGAALWLAACDTGPGPEPLDKQPPTVSDLTVAPETIRIAELPADQVSGGQAVVDLTLAASARDADGTVDRVLAIIDPVYSGSAAGITQLDPLDGARYGGVRRYAVAADRADVFTIRVLAIDNDSLTSNEVVRQFRIIPADSN